MRVRVIITDLDGTLLEPDASVHPDVPAILARLGALGVPVCPLSSKTPAEVGQLAGELGLSAPAGFENGAGLRHADGRTTLGASAVPVDRLREVLAQLRARTGVSIRSLDDLSDKQLATLTGLDDGAVALARLREATLPLVVHPSNDGLLHAALPDEPPTRLIRGNRFLHLQGRHDKADVVPELLEALRPGEGLLVACGDAPNDADLLAAADVRVIVPSKRGPHPSLVERFPDARVAPLPNGAGWAAAIRELLDSA